MSNIYKKNKRTGFVENHGTDYQRFKQQKAIVMKNLRTQGELDETKKELAEIKSLLNRLLACQ